VQASRFVSLSCLLDFRRKIQMLSLTAKQHGEEEVLFFCPLLLFFSTLRKQTEPPLKDKDFSALVFGIGGDYKENL